MVCCADCSQYLYGRSIAVANDLTSPDTPLEAAVLFADTVFKCHFGAWLIHRLLHRASQRLPIASLLADNDAYELHKRLGTLIRTGPTDTNVGDLQVALVY